MTVLDILSFVVDSAPMKRLLVLCLLGFCSIVVLALALTPVAFAAPQEKPVIPWLPPWNGLSWGMSGDAIATAKPDSVVILPQTVGPLTAVYQLPSGPLGNLDFPALAQVDSQSGQLRQVAMSHQGLVDPKSLDLIRQMLTFQFGNAELVCKSQNPGKPLPNLDILWISGPTVIHLMLFNFATLKFAGSDAIKAIPVWESQLFAKNLNPQLVIVRAHARTDMELIQRPQCTPVH